MCLSSVFNRAEDSRALLRNVVGFSLEPGGIRFWDIMEQESFFPAALVSADLINGRVIIDLEGQA